MTSELNHPTSYLAEANISSKQTLGFFVATPAGHIVEANEVLLERLGMTQEALGPENALHCHSILSPESWTLWEQQWPDLARQKFIAPRVLDFRSLDGDPQERGRLLSAQVSIMALRDGSGSGACLVQFEGPEQTGDTTTPTSLRRFASSLVPESEVAQDIGPVSSDDSQYFRMLTDASPAQIFDMAPDGTLRFLNQTALDYFDPERMPEIRKGHWAPEIHPDDLENISQLVQDALEGKRESYRIEIYRWFFHSGNRCYYPNGDFYGLVGYSIDITAFKEAELELKASEERFRIIANASPAHIFDMAPDGTFRFLNQAVMDFLSPERMPEIMKGRWDSEVHPDDLNNMTQLVQDALEGKRESYRLELRSKRRDGIYRWFFHSGNRCYYPNGDFYGLVGYSIDITAFK
ncbi:MAG: sensor hybrid histidine kinase, partial [Vampirovibrio sp.]|nr:sensor hybrid histidine kinase [Vampirovibrio sp.]